MLALRKIKPSYFCLEGRKQAYGWSLPSTYASDTPGQLAVPIPVYCRPLNTEAAMKVSLLRLLFQFNFILN